MPRKQYRVRVTGDQREHIDPHQIAQILLDLVTEESRIEQTMPDVPESRQASRGGVRRIERPQAGNRLSKKACATPADAR